MPDPTMFEIWEYMHKSRHPRMIWWRLNPKQKVVDFASLFCHGRARLWRKRLSRPAALLIEDPGAGRPEGNWIGAVRLGLRGEGWPLGRDGRPMTPVVQMNVAESPFVPEPLKGVRLLTMYVSVPDDKYDEIYLPDWEDEEPAHGDGWCVRTYQAEDDLVEITPPPRTRLPRPMPMRWEFLANDTPSSLTGVCEASWPTRIAYDHKVHRAGTRLGGWPTFIQGPWPWRPWSKKPGAPFYVLQVHGGDGFCWCDAGAASVGIADDGRWVITWQSY